MQTIYISNGLAASLVRFFAGNELRGKLPNLPFDHSVYRTCDWWLFPFAAHKLLAVEM